MTDADDLALLTNTPDEEKQAKRGIDPYVNTNKMEYMYFW